MKQIYSRLLYTLSVCLFITGNIHSQTFTVNNSGSNNGFSVMDFTDCNSPNGDEYRLLSNNDNSSATSIWAPNTVDLNNGFEIDFSIRFNNDQNDNGADGICFVLQDSGPNTLGSFGGYLGYAFQNGNTYNSLAVEFDIFNNNTAFGDIADDHVALVYDCDLANPEVAAISLGNIEDGEWHQVHITWDPCGPTFDVDIDTVNVIHHNEDILNDVFPNNSIVNWGFTSGKASESADHDICIQPIVIDSSCCGELCEEETDLTACAAEGDYGYIALKCNANFDWTFPAGSTAIEYTTDECSIILNASEGTYQVAVTYPDSCFEIREYEIIQSCCDSISKECKAPENLRCQKDSNGQLQLAWNPVAEAVAYTITIVAGPESGCECDNGLSWTFSDTIEDPFYDITAISNSCFSWQVTTHCKDGSTSEPSPKECFDKYTECNEVSDEKSNNQIESKDQEFEQIKLFPNPAENSINIQSDKTLSTYTSIRLYDTTGRPVMVIPTGDLQHQNRVKWPIPATVSNGIYYLKFQLATGESITRKVVIQK